MAGDRNTWPPTLLSRSQLRKLGAEAVRAARQFQADGTCDYADVTQAPPP